MASYGSMHCPTNTNVHFIYTSVFMILIAPNNELFHLQRNIFYGGKKHTHKGLLNLDNSY